MYMNKKRKISQKNYKKQKSVHTQEAHHTSHNMR